MVKDDRTTVEILSQIDSYQRMVMDSVDTPFEGNVRSATNELLAYEMKELGERVADAELTFIEESDELSRMREKRKVDLMMQVDPETDKFYSATKAESKVELVPEVREKLTLVRRLRHNHKVLDNKSKSIWEWLNNSRSRLSWLGKEVVHGS